MWPRPRTTPQPGGKAGILVLATRKSQRHVQQALKEQAREAESESERDILLYRYVAAGKGVGVAETGKRIVRIYCIN